MKKTEQSQVSDQEEKVFFFKELEKKINDLIEVWEETWMTGHDGKEDQSHVEIMSEALKKACEKKGLTDWAMKLEGVKQKIKGPLEDEDKNAISEELNNLMESLKERLKKEEGPEKKNTMKPRLFHHEGVKKKVWFFSKDKELIKECVSTMSHYGYQAFVFETLDDFKKEDHGDDPVATLVDLDHLDEGLANNWFKKEMKKHPIVAMSSIGDFKSRIRAVRGGSDAFFTKPINLSTVLDKLDALVNHANIMDPYKVLVIEDSATSIHFLKQTLEQEGMVVHVEEKPEKVLSAVGEFNPDLILMDMYMPHCDGEELSRIIRQYEAYTSIPIVFLSSETDVNKQLEVMSLGADDFLTKPIQPDHLISSIRTRIKRHRILSSYMIQDSLTGLLNHTKVKQQLDHNLEKALRSKIPMAFAMVDIDFFKKVNDTYGHPMGDQVIKSLSKLLQKRLRKTDSIGRYGGEEFAIIFWDATALSASRVLDEIREDFLKIEHHYENQVFSCTFSGGVAGFPTYSDSQALGVAADKALYESKRNGRNKITIASDD